MNEWLLSLKDNFSFSDVIALLSMIAAVIAAVFSWINKIKAKKSEAQAKTNAELAAQYAKNANETFTIAKEYFVNMNMQIIKHNEAEETLIKHNKTKDEILCFILANNPVSVNKIAEHCKLDIEHTKEILKEMWKKDRTVKPPNMSGNPENMDDCIWWKYKKE